MPTVATIDKFKVVWLQIPLTNRLETNIYDRNLQWLVPSGMKSRSIPATRAQNLYKGWICAVSLPNDIQDIYESENRQKCDFFGGKRGLATR